MNGEPGKIAFPEWGTPVNRPPQPPPPPAGPQCAPAGCNVAHAPAPQDELLLRTKAQWEKQQAAAAAAMCYWGYAEQSPLMQFAKNEWRPMNCDRPPDCNPPQNPPSTVDNGQIQIPRCPGIGEPPPHIKPVKEPRSKKRSRVVVPSPPTMVPCGSPSDEAGSSMGRPYPCNDCSKTFRQHSQLLTHQRTHTGDRPFLCTDCPKAFRTQGTLAIHRRIHTGEKPYSCEECGRSFRTQGTLVIHRRTHTGDRPYKCQDCGKAFAARCSLVVHWRTHTGEKPYMCTECGKLFSSRSDSARHTRTHQPGASGKKAYIRRIIQQHPALQ